MSDFTKNFESLTARRALYRVWVPLRDDGRVPLVSIWIDSTMTTFEPQPQQKGIGFHETSQSVMADEFEDPSRCIADAATAIELVPNAAQWTDHASAVALPCVLKLPSSESWIVKENYNARAEK